MNSLTSFFVPSFRSFFSLKNKPLRLFFGLLLLIGGAGLPAFRPALTSSLTIPAGQQFQLGGGQLLGFAVAAKNAGPVAIVVRELTGKGAVLERGTLAPGQKAKLRFGAGSRALLLNRTDRVGEVAVEVTGFNTSNLSMGYDKAGK